VLGKLRGVTDEVRPSDAPPDVSVVVAVYNTMPYLTRCLESLVRQSIGRRRLEVIAVDDGSTDGSAAELAAFARRYPEMFVVLSQPNSGGPAAPSNRGLERATGRYVFFLGADDYLGKRALENMVAVADAYDADIVAGRMVGDNGRFVPQDIFFSTDYDVDLYTSALPFAVSNTKLFRRELLDKHHVRYAEDMPFGSDQPFTVAACVHARRICVLADYDYYYAVKRSDRDNITYRSSHELRLECTGRIMDATAGLIPPGEQRDAVMIRSFYSELSKLTRSDFRKLDRDVQERVVAGIGDLADRYLTAGIRARLETSRRVRILLAQRRDLDALLSVVTENARKQVPMVVDNGRLYLAYHCFRDERGWPDEWFFISDNPAELVARQVDVRKVTWVGPRLGRDRLIITAVSPTSIGEIRAARLRVMIGESAAAVRLEPRGEGTVLRITFRLRQLMTECPRLGGQRQIVAQVAVGGDKFSAPLRLPAKTRRRRRLGHIGVRYYFVTPVRQPDSEFALEYRLATRAEVTQSVRDRIRALRRRTD
jgi:poly(ribitol-phosphate) beta-N-acetylglucosaminyltransferase